jgi:hypothetical protein
VKLKLISPICLIALLSVAFAFPSNQYRLSVPTKLTSQTLAVSGNATASKDADGNVKVTCSDGTVLFDAAQPIPIIVVGLKTTGPNISLTANPNHVSITVSGSGTSDVMITGPSWTVEATGVVTTTSGF